MFGVGVFGVIRGFFLEKAVEAVSGRDEVSSEFSSLVCAPCSLAERILHRVLVL